MSLRSSYIICTTPRTGSNFLCEVLGSTGVMGHPDQYLWNPDYWREQWQASGTAAYRAAMLQAGTTPNGVFAIKLMDYELDALAALFRGDGGKEPTETWSVVSNALPELRYIWLTRRDKVRQAISVLRAHQTGHWRSTDRHLRPAAREPSFDFELIDLFVSAAVLGDAAWQEYFAAAGVEPLAVVYEDLARDPHGTAERVLSYLGIDSRRSLFRDTWRHQKQGDELSDEWARRYRELKLEALSVLP